jgi:hypothetical protein
MLVSASENIRSLPEGQQAEMISTNWKILYLRIQIFGAGEGLYFCTYLYCCMIAETSYFNVGVQLPVAALV